MSDRNDYNPILDDVEFSDDEMFVKAVLIFGLPVIVITILIGLFASWATH